MYSGFVKDILNLNDPFKSFFLSLFLSPLWIIVFYFLNNSFYLKTDMIIIILLSAILSSTTSYLLYIGLSINKGLPENNFVGNMTFSVMFLYIWLMLLFFICYSLCFFIDQQIYTYWFIVIYYVPIFYLYIHYFIFNKEIPSHAKK